MRVHVQSAALRAALVPAFVTAATAWLLLAFDEVFLANDDVVMAAAASGDLTGTPDPHLVFVGAIPGFLISSAYRLVPDIAWYGVFLLVCQIAALSVVFAAFRRRHVALDPGQWFALSLVAVAFVPVFTLRLTFTVVAILLGLAGVVLFVDALDRARRARALAAAGGCLAIGLCAMVRAEAVMAIAAFSVPTLLVVVSRAGIRRAVPVAVGVVSLLGLTALTDHLLYADEDWTEFVEFNSVRGAIHGTERFAAALSPPDSPELLAAVAANGWTLDDVYLFAHWFFDDPATYSTEKLERFSDSMGDATFTAPLGSAVRSVVEPHPALGLVVLVATAAAAIGAGRRRLVLLAAQLVWASGVFVVVAWRERFPDRIGFPLFFSVAVLQLLAVRLFPSDRPRASSLDRAGAVAAAAIAVAVFVVAPTYDRYGPGAISAYAGDLRSYLDHQTAALRDLDPNGRFVYVGSAVATEGASPLHVATPYQDRRLLGLGWPTYSPLQEERKRLMSLDPDLMTALLADENVHLVASQPVVDLIQGAYLARRGIDVEVLVERDLGFGVMVYGLRRT